MPSTTKTSNLQLSHFEETDKPKWLCDYNNDMLKIDAAVALKITNPNGSSSQVLNGQGVPITPTDTPISESTLPFTAGGAFTELNKKISTGTLVFEGTALDISILEHHRIYLIVPVLEGFITFMGTQYPVLMLLARTDFSPIFFLNGVGQVVYAPYNDKLITGMLLDVFQLSW